MAFSANEFGRDIAVPGLVIHNQPYQNLSGVMADGSTKCGGFAAYAVKGDDGKIYATKPSSVNGVARVLEVTPVLGTAAAGTVKVKKNGTVVATATTTSESTVASVIDALVASWNEDLYTPTDGTTKLTVTAKAQTALRNSDVFEMVYSADVGFSGDIAQTTAGVTAKEGGYFLGVVQYEKTKDSFPQGATANVIIDGLVMVKVAADVQSGANAYVDGNGDWAASGTQVTGAKYLSSAKNGGFAVLKIN